MGFVLAGIKDRKEAAQRLINGEIFYSGFTPRKVWFDADNARPFRHGDLELVTDWDCVRNWLILEKS